MASYGSAHKDNVYYEILEAVASSSNQGRMEEHVTRSVQNVRSKDLISGRLIGKGPSSIVYETKWEGKSYARKDFLRVPGDIFEREAAALVGLDHPNVLQTYCWTVDEGSCSLVLELMDDDLLEMMQKRLDSQRKKSPGSDSASQKSQLIDLHMFIKDRQNSPRGTVSESSSAAPLLYPFDTLEALRIILQVAEGMKFLHDKGIVHGDLKPKNILVTSRGRVASSSLDKNMAFKVADFGLVGTKMKSRTLVSRQARRLEMVRWRAPELLNLSRLQEDEHESSSDSDWDSSDQIVGMHVQNFTFMDMARADVYNFGLTCSQILNGEEPYSGLGVKDLMNKVTFSGMRPKLPPEYPDQLSDLIKLCLSEKTARPSFQDILNELNDLQASLTWTGSPMNTIIGLSAGHIGSKLVSEGSKVDQEETVPIGNKQHLSNCTQDSSVDPTLEGLKRRQRTRRVLSRLGSLACVTSKVESSSSNISSMSRLSDTDDVHKEKEDISILKKRSSGPKGKVDFEEIMLKDLLRRFSFHEIEKLTDHFSDANAVGLTGTGEFKLFAGRETRTGARVVVKMASRGLDPAKDFYNEITLLSRVHHNNVVGLVGVCAEDEPALVYDDVVNGSVKDWLHGSQSYPPLDWYGRLKIALGAARGLAYLHDQATPIIHRDVKSYNILLDEKLNTKIAHFGLALLATDGADIPVESSPICGTPFYIDPEYISTGHVSTKSDVYGFGMVLLEVVIGKPPVSFDETIRNKIGNTFEYRRGDLAGLRELLDPAIAAATEEDLEKFVTLACSCRAALPSQRPSMREVVQQLESLVAVVQQLEILVAQTHKEPRQTIPQETYFEFPVFIPGGTSSHSPEQNQLADTIRTTPSLLATHENQLDAIRLMLEAEPPETGTYSFPETGTYSFPETGTYSFPETGTYSFPFPETAHMSHMNLLDSGTNNPNNGNPHQSASIGTQHYGGLQQQLEPKAFKPWQQARVQARKKPGCPSQDLLRRCFDMMKQISHVTNKVPVVATEAQPVMHNLPAQYGSGLASSSSPETVAYNIAHDPFDPVPPRGQRRPRGGSKSAIIGAVHHGHNGAAMTHMMAQRRRRVRQKENLAALRDLVPIISNANKASILGDAIIYLKQLKTRSEELEAGSAESQRKYETLQKSYNELEQRNKELESMVPPTRLPSMHSL